MPNLLSGDDEVNLKSNGLKFAWSAQLRKGVVINNPKYIRWVVMASDWS